jgi:hypothetical protein
MGRSGLAIVAVKRPPAGPGLPAATEKPWSLAADQPANDGVDADNHLLDGVLCCPVETRRSASGFGCAFDLARAPSSPKIK